MKQTGPTLIALLHGPDRPGLVASVSGWIFQRGGNIVHADQHDDGELGVFFQRVEWRAAATDLLAEAAAFEEHARGLGMEVRVALSSAKPRVAVMVSQYAHACHELLLDWREGDLPCEIVGLISNHEDIRPTAEAYGLPFRRIAVSAESKAAAETEQLAQLAEWKAETLVLARYMQVLSPIFIERFGWRIINIHHSFLPAFAGAKPYHQAHGRGVKLIGATAHYVTPVLDDGPIIHQNVSRVSHRDTVADMQRKGRDLEKLVLSEALRLHVTHRVLVYGNKTVVFD